MAYRNMMAMGESSLQERINNLERDIPKDTNYLEELKEELEKLEKKLKGTSYFFKGPISKKIATLRSLIESREESLIKDKARLKRLKEEKEEEEERVKRFHEIKNKMRKQRNEEEIAANIRRAENRFGPKTGGSRKKSKGSKKRSTRRK